MDIDGLFLLIKGDRHKFDDWLKSSKSFSLEELRNSYNQWRVHYNEIYEKYNDLKTGDVMKDAHLMATKMMYFHDLSIFMLYALSAYTVKLQKEYDLLKKASKPRAKKVTKKGG